MYRPRDDMRKTSNGENRSPDEPYLPVPGTLTDRFMRSYTKLMRHPRSRTARNTARATFPHYVADILDRHCAANLPDENPADRTMKAISTTMLTMNRSHGLRTSGRPTTSSPNTSAQKTGAKAKRYSTPRSSQRSTAKRYPT